MNEALFHSLNGWVGTSNLLDEVALHLASNPLFKGIPVLLIFWFYWGLSDAAQRQRQIRLLALIGCVALTMLLTRLAVAVLPFSPRPIHNPDLTMRVAVGLDTGGLTGETSFPSDHASLGMSLAVGLLLVGRIGGLLALAHALVFSMAARVYFGFHWPYDVLAGAMLGGIVTLLALRPLEGVLRSAGAEAWLQHRQHWVLPVVFLATLQIATSFQSLRWFLDAAGTALERLF